MMSFVVAMRVTAVWLLLVLAVETAAMTRVMAFFLLVETRLMKSFRFVAFFLFVKTAVVIGFMTFFVF
jgi:hypothetical protein